ncbi:TPA_asm: protein 2 [Primula virus 1]|uniref:Protein 2 n=1 Tax=Primula virus 1 TaxID=2977982 RepID=A0A9N6YJP2_9RHAB|nr:TPA_asm: protein 2 [Primula virus 1]
MSTSSFSKLANISLEDINKRVNEEIQPTVERTEVPDSNSDSDAEVVYEESKEDIHNENKELECEYITDEEDDRESEEIEKNSIENETLNRRNPVEDENDISGVLDALNMEKHYRSVATSSVKQFCDITGECLAAGEHGAAVRFLIENPDSASILWSFISGYRAHTYDWAASMERSVKGIDKCSSAMKLRVIEIERIRKTAVLDSYNVIDKLSKLYESIRDNLKITTISEPNLSKIIPLPPRRPSAIIRVPTVNTSIPIPKEQIIIPDPIAMVNKKIAENIHADKSDNMAEELNAKFNLKLSEEAVATVDISKLDKFIRESFELETSELKSKEKLNMSEKNLLKKALTKSMTF